MSPKWTSRCRMKLRAAAQQDSGRGWRCPGINGAKGEGGRAWLEKAELSSGACGKHAGRTQAVLAGGTAHISQGPPGRRRRPRQRRRRLEPQQAARLPPPARRRTTSGCGAWQGSRPSREVRVGLLGRQAQPGSACMVGKAAGAPRHEQGAPLPVAGREPAPRGGSAERARRGVRRPSVGPLGPLHAGWPCCEVPKQLQIRWGSREPRGAKPCGVCL